MALSPRFDLRPLQRGRDGIPGLNIHASPRFEEIMIDRLDVSVRGLFGSTTTENRAGQLFDQYQSMLLQQLQRNAGDWRNPHSGSRAKFRIRLREDASTISSGSIKVDWERDKVSLGVRLTLNPTRTLVHRLPELAETDDPIRMLTNMSPDQFFARAGRTAAAQTIDENDNAFASPAQVRALLGEDFPSSFLEIYEAQLQRWMITAVAPRSLGFTPVITENDVRARSGQNRVSLDWRRLTVWKAEAYFERRHSAARLMNRLRSVIPASQTGARWRSWGVNEFGGRLSGSEVIGLDLTKTVQQAIYAKTQDRVRIETRYNGGVRDTLRQPIDETSDISTVLSDLLAHMRHDTVHRARWEEFCRMCNEPFQVTLGDAVHLMAAISGAALSAKVDPVPVLAELLGTGGIDETASEGAAPSRLIRRLASDGVIETSNLQRRRRPGQQRRHRLAAGWMDTAERLQQAFTDEDDLLPD